MRKTIPFLLMLIIILGAVSVTAQETYFGKNKVQYRSFDWNYIQTDHFDVYFYDDQIELAKFAAGEMEHAYGIITEQLNYYVARRIPVFIYNSHNDFQQTNIIWQEPSEGTQGFTEVFKNRIVVHFMGSYEEFRHLLHHELSHAVIFDMLYGQFFKSILSSNRLFQLPLWFAEGYAEYTSNGGWAQRADMMVRDATINGYLRPPGYMGFQAYTEGYALVKYIVDNYGIEKLGEILHKGKTLMTMDRALESSIGMTSEKLYEKFAKEMKKRYWPDISKREEPGDFAKRLTHHGKDGSRYNEKPVFAPKGQMLAMFTDRNSYTEIYLISAIDGKEISRLVKGERNANLESLRWYTSGVSFSPDAENLVFVSKSNGEDALNFLKIKGKDIYLRKKFGLKSIISPAWSPDGKLIIFSALQKAKRNLYMYNIEKDAITILTNDNYDEKDVSWFPSSTEIAFTSDRPHPDDFDDIDPNRFVYGSYNLYRMNIEDGKITPIMVGPGANTEPSVSPDGKKIAFVSNRNGIDNIYIHYVDSSRVLAATNILTSATSPSWSADGKMIAFSTFFKGGYDIYVIKDTKPKGINGALAATDFILGKYDTEGEWARLGDHVERIENDEALANLYSDPDFPSEGSGHASLWNDSDAPKDEDGSVTEAKISDIQDEESDPKPVVAVSGDDQEGEESNPGEADNSSEGVTDEEEVYVYNAPDDGQPSAFVPEGEVTDDGEVVYERVTAVDSLSAALLDNVESDGSYRVRPYKTRFSPDIIAGGLQYDTFFGFRGQTVFLFSDYLGDHHFMIATDLVNTIDQSNLQVYYYYNKMRVDMGVGLFHTKNYYVDPNNDLFSDRFYGFSGSLSWPRSKFTRIDLNSANVFIDRKFHNNINATNEDVRITTLSLSWTHDTVLWGITGPRKGRRYKITTEGATPLFGDKSVDYYSGDFDYRQYMPLGQSFSFALRFSGGFSNGSQPKNYFLGGNTNRVGTVRVNSEVYDVENLYFSSVVTPLRGFDYYEIKGTRFAMTNMELRFPFIEYFLMRYPLQIGLSRVTGALFMDMGAAWDQNGDFKGGTSEGDGRLLGIKTGFGFGARANLGFLLLRYDVAWVTDFNSVEPHSKHYFSLGADF